MRRSDFHRKVAEILARFAGEGHAACDHAKVAAGEIAPHGDLTTARTWMGYDHRVSHENDFRELGDCSGEQNAETRPDSC